MGADSGGPDAAPRSVLHKKTLRLSKIMIQSHLPRFYRELLPESEDHDGSLVLALGDFFPVFPMFSRNLEAGLYQQEATESTN